MYRLTIPTIEETSKTIEQLKGGKVVGIDRDLETWELNVTYETIGSTANYH